MYYLYYLVHCIFWAQLIYSSQIFYDENLWRLQLQFPSSAPSPTEHKSLDGQPEGGIENIRTTFERVRVEVVNLTFDVQFDLGDCVAGEVEALADVVAGVFELHAANHQRAVVEDGEATVVLIGEHERLWTTTNTRCFSRLNPSSGN